VVIYKTIVIESRSGWPPQKVAGKPTKDLTPRAAYLAALVSVTPGNRPAGNALPAAGAG
jgi:hypothetical protein